MKKEKAFEYYRNKLIRDNERKKVERNYCVESEDEKHLHDITKRLCRGCYSYQDTNSFNLSPYCQECNSLMLDMIKQYGISRFTSLRMLRIKYEYRRLERIAFLKRWIEENQENSPYSMVSGRVIDIKKDSVLVDYNGIQIHFNDEELEVLRRIREKRMCEEYNNIRRTNNKCLNSLKELF